MTTDIIDRLVGVEPEDGIDVLRRARPDARAGAQRSYEALFGDDVDQGHVSLVERLAVAAWTTALTGVHAPADWFAAELATADAAVASTVTALVADATVPGPYGAFPAGPLTASDEPGIVWEPSSATRAELGDRLAAALVHAHLLVLHPRDASPVALQSLLDAGWTTTGIVTLSQLVAFLQFQTRVVAGLIVLKETRA